MGFFVWLQQIMGQAQGKKGPIQLQGMAQQEWTQILHCSRDSCWGSRSAHPCWSSETPGKNIPEISCATKASTGDTGVVAVAPWLPHRIKILKVFFIFSGL